MRVWVLGSGSAGNAVLVESGGTRVLIDAGFPVRELAKRLGAIGVSGESIDSAIVTHEHTDRVRGGEEVEVDGVREHRDDRGPSAAQGDLRAPVRGGGDARARRGERRDRADAARRHRAGGRGRDVARNWRARGNYLRSRARARIIPAHLRASRHSRARVESRRGDAARGTVSAERAVADRRGVWASEQSARGRVRARVRARGARAARAGAPERAVQPACDRARVDERRGRADELSGSDECRVAERGVRTVYRRAKYPRIGGREPADARALARWTRFRTVSTFNKTREEPFVRCLEGDFTGQGGTTPQL